MKVTMDWVAAKQIIGLMQEERKIAAIMREGCSSSVQTDESL